MGEGVAEFLSHYLIDPAKAKKLAPKYYDYFENAVKSNESMKNAFRTPDGNGKTYTKQDPFASILSNVSIGEKKKKGLSFKQLYSQLVESDIAAKAATQKIVGKDYAKLSTDMNPHELMTLREV